VTVEDTLEPCHGCGLRIAGGAVGCQGVMDEIIAKHFSEVTYFGAHRLFVDVYSVQHPDRYCASFKSLAAHLGHLCWSLEHGGTWATPCEPLRRWVERHPHLEKPALPAFRGRLTVADVAAADGPAAHRRAIEAWARDAWEAYGSLHGLARHWVNEALGR